MGVMFLLSDCGLCHKTMMSNPEKVPVIRIEGERETICADCVRRYQAYQKQHGLPVWPDPHPDAYKPVDERDL